MGSPWLLQMAGWMGTGKSTIARLIAQETHAVVLDHDTTKTAAMAAGVTDPPPGSVSYDMIFALTGDLLSQGRSVIIDSPSLYPTIADRGQAIAVEWGASYFFVECRCADDLATARLEARAARLSQVVTGAEAAAVRSANGRVPHGPSTGVLTLDTTVGLADSVATVRAYLSGGGASGPSVPREARPTG